MLGSAKSKRTIKPRKDMRKPSLVMPNWRWAQNSEEPAMPRLEWENGRQRQQLGRRHRSGDGLAVREDQDRVVSMQTGEIRAISAGPGRNLGFYTRYSGQPLGQLYRHEGGLKEPPVWSQKSSQGAVAVIHAGVSSDVAEGDSSGDGEQWGKERN